MNCKHGNGDELDGNSSISQTYGSIQAEKLEIYQTFFNFLFGDSVHIEMKYKHRDSVLMILLV